MKALFYTATAVFITLAGVIAFFALRTPDSSVGGARVVIAIDASAMPAAENAAAPSGLDPYGNEPDDKPAADATTEDSAPPAEITQSQSAPSQQANAAVVEQPAVPTAETSEENVPAPPPGTALAGLENDRPIFREVAPNATPGQPDENANTQGEPAALAAAPQEEPEFHLPGTNIALPQEKSAEESDGLRGGADLSPKEKTAGLSSDAASVAAIKPAAAPETQAAIPAPPPPPLPKRRPTDIPGPDDRSENGGWAGVQFAATDAAQDRPARIAILLKGVGRSEQDSADAIAKLPSAVSLGFLPYAGAPRLASEAREKGHEIIVQLPLEPTDYPTSNPGPETLLTSLPAQENAARLQAVLDRFDGHSGVTNFMGGKMLQSKNALKPVLEEIKARGLVYVGENNSSHNTVRQVAREINLRYGAAQVLIDIQSNPEAIDKALTRLTAIARQSGSAIGIGNATALTIEQVQAWSERLAEQGITLVPVGALAQAPGSS
jgi:polysaccharide deacetylase 2 family uncharacterized protein YibQ